MKGNWITIDKKSGNGNGGQSSSNKWSGLTSSYPTGGTQGGGHSTGGGSGTSKGSASHYNSQSFGTSLYQGSDTLSKEQQDIALRYTNIIKGFTGKVLGGAYHPKIHVRHYEEKPPVNKEMLHAVRKLDKDNNPKAINFILFNSHYLDDDDMYWLSSAFNTHKYLAVNTVDLSNNCLLLVKDNNLSFFSLKPYNMPRNIIKLDLSNNNIGDAGAEVIADGLANGVFPITRMIDVSGNNMSWESNALFAKASNNLRQDIKILINKVLPISSITSGLKKQSDLFFGSKEEKHAIIKDYLKHAQSNGIDIQNVAVSKSIFEKIGNSLKLYFNYQVGFAKCNIVPEDATSFAAGAIIAKISKKATGVMTATDAVACYFEVFDENVSSQEGIQFMLDAGIVTTTDLLGNVE